MSFITTLSSRTTHYFTSFTFKVPINFKKVFLLPNFLTKLPPVLVCSHGFFMINFGPGTFTIMFTFNSTIELQLFQSSEENFRKKSLFTSVIGEVQRSNCALREKVQAMFL